MSWLVWMAAVMVPTGAALGQVSLGFHNDFEDGTSQNWTNGGSAPDPENFATGGPAGAGDSWIRISSDGSGGGGKLTMFNNLDWWGDYLTPGITQIEVDLLNLDPQSRALSIRLGFRISSNQGSPGWCTSVFNLPADGRWHHAVFSLTPGTMTSIGGAPSWATAMSNVGEVRLFHSTGASLTGTNIVSALGVDNIAAVPSPSAAMVLGLGALATRRRRRR